MNKSSCPFCLQENQCTSDITCWCAKELISSQLVALVPEHLKHKTCICYRCVVSFNLDPAAFIAKINRS
ncbi:cysteine-rich CWC family protein [Psychromonas aquatilis]|uniref:cysteine-rich CWC family protein n=1 Tax=Psychromonas aquatilis TaxID=2005072 RepID=UPI003C7708EF